MENFIKTEFASFVLETEFDQDEPWGLRENCELFFAEDHLYLEMTFYAIDDQIVVLVIATVYNDEVTLLEDARGHKILRQFRLQFDIDSYRDFSRRLMDYKLTNEDTTI